MNGLGISAADVRTQTSRILASRHFQGSERLGNFLRYVVEETLEGRSREIKEYVIGVAVYRKGQDFDPRIDSTVRVEASRLRRRLASFYDDEGRHDAVVISVPKGGYVPAFEGRAPAVEPATKKGRLPRAAPVLAGVLVICAGVGWRLTSKSAERPISGMKEIPLTSLPGLEMAPSFSPDGEAVAFVWTRDLKGELAAFEDPGARVFLTSVKGGSPRRLTKTDVGTEAAPGWAPSGDEIALLGNVLGEAFIYLVPVIDGQPRKIAPVPGANPEGRLSWSPDGRLLTYAQRDGGRAMAVHTVSIPEGRTRQLTTPPASIQGDADPAFSPDGRWIVFVRRKSSTVSDLYLIPAAGGEAKPITSLSSDIRGKAWMPDSREIIFGAERAGAYSLMRIRIDDRGVPSKPRAMADIGGDVMYPALSHPKGGVTELAFARVNKSMNIWRAADLTPKHKPEFSPIAPSTRTDYDPNFSPDGASIAFASDRMGSFEIWVCDKDGTNLRQLTSFGGPDVGTPRWSPDGRYIAFDARPGNNPDIYVVDSGGGPVQRITSESSDDARPSWSADGRWIYFRSDRGGQRQIWKIPYTGHGEPSEHAQRVTIGTAHEALESPDGKWVYFVRQPNVPLLQDWWGIGSELRRVPAGGGPEEKVLDGVRSGSWALAESGIFFVEAGGKPGAPSSTVVRVAQSNPVARTVIATIDKLYVEDSTAFAVSRDGRDFLMVFRSRLDSDLFLVNDFR